MCKFFFFIIDIVQSRRRWFIEYSQYDFADNKLINIKHLLINVFLKSLLLD